MPSILCFSPAAGLRTLCLASTLALVACGSGSDPEPTDKGGDDSTDEPATATAKDASTRKQDAGKASTSSDASISDPAQIKPKDAGRPPVKEPEPIVDAGAPTTPATKPDSGSTPVTPPSGDGGTGVSGIAAADLDMLRTVCVDEINMYRAMFMLAPLTRADAQHEACSDEGAKVDGDSKQPHGWANAGYKCTSLARAGFSAQNTCPGWPASSASAIASSLKMCLKQMWAEGEPPEGTDKCLSDYFAGNTACFLAHGHYINMKNSMFKKVSCSFYNMGKSTYWMNQDFQ
jgi:hypothetical protein